MFSFARAKSTFSQRGNLFLATAKPGKETCKNTLVSSSTGSGRPGTCTDFSLVSGAPKIRTRACTDFWTVQTSVRVLFFGPAK